MGTQGDKAIWIVDDDKDDHELIREIFADMKWQFPVELFVDAEALIKRLDEADIAPFIIISDVNLPKMDGFALREKMLKAANNKFHSVPFIFWSTQASEVQIRKAYRLRAHGFFLKEAKFHDWKRSLVRIIEYWTQSLVPSKEDKGDQPLQ
jgi:DNA-binding NtrC family response regulator